MPDYAFTRCFPEEVLRKRPYRQRAWCIAVIEQPLLIEPQEESSTLLGGDS
ncbi:MAG: hypothetical protein ABIW79_06500 [Gemmatimonas sp.]